MYGSLFYYIHILCLTFITVTDVRRLSRNFFLNKYKCIDFIIYINFKMLISGPAEIFDYI